MQPHESFIPNCSPPLQELGAGGTYIGHFVGSGLWGQDLGHSPRKYAHSSQPVPLGSVHIPQVLPFGDVTIRSFPPVSMQCFDAGFGMSGLVDSLLQAATLIMPTSNKISDHFIVFSPLLPS